MKLRTLVIPIALLLALLFPRPVAYAALISKDIGAVFILAPMAIRARITELIDQGQDKDQIIASFVSQYGEKMLSSPSKKGFNLVAWIAPFAAVTAGGTVLFFMLRAWATKGKSLKVAETDGYHGRLEDELKKFRGEDIE